MNKYQNLLLTIANRYNIKRGDSELIDEWKTRIIYSICGLMAYTSLWDGIEEKPISITHLKHRVRSVHNSYLELYPEITSFFPFEKQELEDEITNLFLKCGIMYHKPNRVSPTRETVSSVGNICFKRGICIDSIQSISGIGFFDVDSAHKTSTTIDEMFCLNELKLSKYWNTLISKAQWSENEGFQTDTEYLRMEPPFSRVYWVNKPYKTNQISLLRTGMQDSQLYYLYRYNNKKLEISPLSAWQVNEQQYRIIACACLHSQNVLPAIDYFIDGNLVHFHLNFLLPVLELYWLKLYSWPETLTKLPSDFYRKCSLNVFQAFKSALSAKEYTFHER